jgi:hypothetical protein
MISRRALLFSSPSSAELTLPPLSLYLLFRTLPHSHSAMRFLDSTPLLKIEDILPFFPDFVVIDSFKDEICDALESYAAHIERLKGDMGDATRAADAIKADIKELDERFVVVDANEKCGSCGMQLLTRQFYVFPCQHSFHADCLIQEVHFFPLSFHLSFSR